MSRSNGSARSRRNSPDDSVTALVGRAGAPRAAEPGRPSRRPARRRRPSRARPGVTGTPVSSANRSWISARGPPYAPRFARNTPPGPTTRERPRRARRASRGSGGGPTAGTAAPNASSANGSRVASPRTERERRRASGLLDELAEHRGREVEADHVDAGPVQREREQAGPDAHLEHAAPVAELRRRPPRSSAPSPLGDRARGVVELGRAVERDRPAHRARLRTSGCPWPDRRTGSGATVTGTRPRGVSASNAEPGSRQRIGTHAYPMLRSSRGDHAPAVIAPERGVALEHGPEVVQRALVGHRVAADVDADELAVEQVRRRGSPPAPSGR